ncbi:MAG: glutamine--fructose-6-phosphate aminotransferase, partial [Fidelibacterota bacterium]
MCGIIGYMGTRDAIPILLNGLKRLEYRGYDSAGVATVNGGEIHRLRRKGKVRQLATEVEDSHLRGHMGIGHTRWATHGIPSEANAHPHCDQSGRIALVHNGIIENYDSLRKVLEKEGVVFSSETDTEVLVQLIGKLYRSDSLTFEEAIQAALRDVVGAYGIVVVSADHPDRMVAARMGSPLVLGIGEGEVFVASDASPIVEYTRNVVYLDDGDLVAIRDGSYEI